MRSIAIVVVLGLVLALIAFAVRSGYFARSDPGQPINSAMRDALGAQQLSPEDATLIAEKFPGAVKTASGLLYVVRTPGEGATPAVGARVTAHYEGRFLDGRTFDSSYARGEPISFAVGVGQVVKGWDEAFLGMRKGEKRTLIVPYWLGYGTKSRGPIPARATLVFDAELVDIAR